MILFMFPQKNPRIRSGFEGRFNAAKPLQGEVLPAALASLQTKTSIEHTDQSRAVSERVIGQIGYSNESVDAMEKMMMQALTLIYVRKMKLNHDKGIFIEQMRADCMQHWDSTVWRLSTFEGGVLYLCLVAGDLAWEAHELSLLQARPVQSRTHDLEFLPPIEAQTWWYPYKLDRVLLEGKLPLEEKLPETNGPLPDTSDISANTSASRPEPSLREESRFAQPCDELNAQDACSAILERLD